MTHPIKKKVRYEQRIPTEGNASISLVFDEKYYVQKGASFSTPKHLRNFLKHVASFVDYVEAELDKDN